MRKHVKSTDRNKRGFSIILVASLGFVMVLMALAMTASLIPVYKNIGAVNQTNQTQAAAELGIQYVFGVLNTDPTNIKPTMPLPLNMSSATVNVTVESLTPSTTSAIYDNDAVMNYSVNPVDYKKITSTATNGLNKSVIVVFVKSLQTLPSTSKTKNIPLFSNALFASDTLSLSGPTPTGDPVTDPSQTLFIKSDQSILKASIASNNEIIMSGATTVAGDVIANNPLTDLTQLKSISIQGSPDNIIGGNLSYNGNAVNNVDSAKDAFTPDSLTNATASANVLGDGARSIAPMYGSINNVGTAQANVAPITSATPTGVAQFTSLSQTESTVAAPGQGQTVNLGDINLSGSSSMTLPAGNYVASSLVIADNAQIKVVSNSNATGVNISVQGNSSLGTPISIGGKGISLPSQMSSATNFQIFYTGNQSVSFDMSRYPSFTGLVYAPNANVAVSMSGKDFYGAISGRNVAMTGLGTFHYDPSTTAPAISTDKKNNTSNSLYYSPVPPDASKTYKIVSWNEPSRFLAP